MDILYGLVSYNLTRRIKEFSVQKIFGASVGEIFRLMSWDYLWIVVIAFAIGAPAGAFLMNGLMKSIYPTEIPSTQWPYIVAITFMLFMVGLTVLTQLRRVTRENPTKTLRND